VEVRADDGTVVALDCGTGARPLGVDLLSRGPTLPEMHILVTHTHWDHIQGFPFFLPAYVAGTRLSVYGARGLERTLEGSLSGQMQHTYFPVQLDELRADIKFEEVGEERFRTRPRPWRTGSTRATRASRTSPITSRSGGSARPRAARTASCTRVKSVTSTSSPASTC
jgi:glyoxylase-like metal-dependent hydrolase (beta-lactamase superfamily II)